MRSLKVLLALALVLCFVATADAADKKKKKKGKGVRGAISAVKQDEGKETGSITIKAGKKGEKVEKTFKVTAETKIQVVTGKKKERKVSEGKFSDLTVGKVVVVVAEEEVAKTVRVVGGGKKKKKKAE